MFKKEINFISDLNLNKIQTLGDRFTIEDIKRCKIHPAIFQYITASIDMEIFSDRKKIENGSICNYSSDRINNYFTLISEEIKRIQRFDLDYIKQILQKSIVFNVNYLANPNGALTKLIFSDSEVKSIEEIIIGLSHAYYYRFLQKILLTYLDKKKVLLMSRDEFILLLNRVDEISKETHLEETIATAVNSMANFFDPNSNTSEKLPIHAIKLYLDEKNLSEFSDRLDNKFGVDATAFFLTNDIINELKSVTPEAEIDIQVTAKVEDDLIIDESENEIVDQFENISENNEIEAAQEELVTNDVDPITSEQIFEVNKEDVEIPNHEILSNDEQNNERLSEITEALEKIDIEPIEEMNSEEKDFNGDENDRDEEVNNDLEEDSKKKNSAAELLTKLIDLNLIYESLLPPLKPFFTPIEKMNSVELINNLSDETAFLVDLSTIKEEIDIKKNKLIKDDFDTYLSNEISEEIISDNEIVNEEYYFEDTQIVENSEEITISADLVEGYDIDINEAIDDVVNADQSEIEYLEENKSLEISTAENDEAQELENLIDDSKLTLNEEDVEEITEVFTDLVYLDKKEIVEDSDNVEVKIINSTSDTIDNKKYDDSNLNSNSVEHQDNYENLSGMLASKDMTKIIEFVFDYDMEDYHSLIEQISKATTENEAFQFTDEYCKNNNIELSAKEVELFKSQISEYFTRIYS